MGAAYGTQNARTAFLFCQSLIKTKHKIFSIFFYGDGVLNANGMTQPESDEFNLIKAWQNLHKKYQVKLHICNSAALRRGIVDNQQSSKINLAIGNLALYFQISGLVELAYAIQISDRVIQF